MTTTTTTLTRVTTAYAAGIVVGAATVTALASTGILTEDDARRRRFIKDVDGILTRFKAIGIERVRRSLDASKAWIDGMFSFQTSHAVEGEEDDDDDVSVMDVKAKSELEQKFHRCARTFKTLLISSDAYFEPGFKAEMYALYKQATKDFVKDAKKPINALDVVGRAKYNAWKEKSKMSKTSAMRAYVEAFAKWGETQNASDDEVDENGHTAADHAAVAEFQAAVERDEAAGAESTMMAAPQSRPIAQDAQTVDENDVKNDALGALSAACRDGDEDAAVMAMKTNRASVNETDAYGRTPLHWCAEGGYAKIAMHLALLDADVNAQDTHGHTPLHYAVNLEDAETSNLLLDWGADVSIEDTDGETPESLGLWSLVPARESAADANADERDVKDTDDRATATRVHRAVARVCCNSIIFPCALRNTHLCFNSIAGATSKTSTREA
jgi:acyl-CoA-binding protein